MRGKYDGPPALRLATWNLNRRVKGAASRLGALLAEHGSPDVIALPEASPRGIEQFCAAARLDWYLHAADLVPADRRVRADGTPRRLLPQVALAGRGAAPEPILEVPPIDFPEKVLAATVNLGGIRTTVVAYHAPPGVSWKILKPRQAVAIARFLAAIDGPAVLAGDFNTPLLDPPEHSGVVTHWHSGQPKLLGEPGDDLLVGHTCAHPLRDAYRTYLREHPAEQAAIAAERPVGPLAVTYRTGPKDPHRFRYDQVWLSADFAVRQVQHLYDEAIAAGTDHALVLVDTAFQA